MSSGSGSGRGAKGQSISGWTAFDLKQRRKQQHGLEAVDSNPYPSLSDSALTAPKSLSILDKPFSSLLVPSIDFPDIKSSKNLLPATTSSLGIGIGIGIGIGTGTTCQNGKLKDLHPWADESLIQDVLAGVKNNVDEALSLLEAMVDEVDKKDKVQLSCNDFLPPHTDTDTDSDTQLDEKENTMINDSLVGNQKQPMDEESSFRLLDIIKSLPIEPEPDWGEDDVYIIYRKDAIRMMRSASRHSKSANDSYLRGDHEAARNFSLKAQEEWAAAERLNSKAAKEILNVRNCKNDLWTLDLHGLHAAEAVEALREHLLSVESLVSSNSLAAQQGMLKQLGTSVAAYVQSSGQLEMEKSGRQQPTSRQRMALLQVITGKGNHSRGSAALPSAIRNFLSDNGYHFDESRPGIFMVRPKFRLLSHLES